MKAVIDIHNHIFRGKDIPLKGYLRSRRYPEWYIRLFSPLLFSVIASCLRREGPEAGGVLCGPVLELVYKYLGQGYRRWAEILSVQDVGEIARRLVETFEHDRIDLYVPLMIDYEYWFKTTGEPAIASQIDVVYREVVLPYKGQVHPFAPFDPARELAFRAGLPGPTDPPNGPPEKYSSLELAKDAVRNRGFIGVKVYNTLGYRPLGNAAVDEKRRSIFRRNGVERYCAFSGEQFDEVLSELYEFCIREQVPITAHCVSNGIEAYPGASFDFASPGYWREVLERFPDLHLNLAHFGWSDPEGYYPKPAPLVRLIRPLVRLARAIGGQRSVETEEPGPPPGQKTWVAEICDMLARYKYLYTDVSHHGVTEDKDLPKFRTAYLGMLRDYPGLLQKRLLFGIDWHVIARVDNYTSFKERYVNLLGGADLFGAPELADFLGGNGLHFLGLLPLGTDPAAGWTRNRERLQRFYQSSMIDPPAWFTATA